MAGRFVRTDDVDLALDRAVYDKLDDATFAGRIPDCPGAVAVGETVRLCENELRSVLEDRILVGLKLKHPLPVIAGIDVNREPFVEPVEAP